MVCIHCPLCCMRHFPTFTELKKHLIHYVEGDLKCPFCDHYAAGLQNLLLHLNVHDDTVKNEVLKNENPDNENNAGDELLEVEFKNSFMDTIHQGDEHLEEYVHDDLVFDGENEVGVTRYTCGMCEIEFASMDLLRDHAVEIHAVSSALVIDGCASMDSEFALQRDNDSKTQGDIDNKEPEVDQYVEELQFTKVQTLELMCEQCGKQFDNYSNLELHKYVHMDRSQWPLECTICHKHFIAKGSFKRHLLAEHGRPNPSDMQNSSLGLNAAKCNICGKVYKTMEHLLQHKQEKHVSCFKCDQCDKIFATERERKKHKIKVHEGRKFLCTVCGKKFHYKGGLTNHSKIHMPVRPFPCEVCEKRFIDASELRRHTMKHTGEKPHVCEVCGIMFRERYRLNVHMRTHTGERPYACTKCDAAFTSSASLRIHKQIHVEGKSFQCTYCSKIFRTRINRYSHMKLHEKPFECDVCNRRFSLQKILRQHRRTHFKDYNCEKCGKEFTACRKLERHERTCGTDILEENDNSQFIRRSINHKQNVNVVCETIENDSLGLSLHLN